MKSINIFKLLLAVIILVAVAERSNGQWLLTGNSISSSSFLGSTNNVSLRFRTFNNQRMILDSVGRLGIGTNSPIDLLDVFDGTNRASIGGNLMRFSRSTGPSYIQASSVGGYLDFVTNGRLVSNDSSNLVLAPDMSSYFNGKLGVGTSSPTSKLHVVGGDAVINGLTIGKGLGSLSLNTALGESALISVTTGNSNTAVGKQTLYQNTSGTENTATGLFALYANSGGSFNTATGVDALRFNTTGIRNTASGNYSLYTNVSGNNNTALGLSALHFNTASDNTATGYQALYNNTTGTLNAAFGLQALNVNTTGSKNTAIGYFANVSSGGLTNATAIGANAYVSANNCLVLGSISGVNGATANTKVGIGISNPTAKLHIKASGSTSTTQSLNIRNSASSVPMLLVRDDGRIGIGLSSPAAQLSISGGQWDLSATEGDFRIGDSNARLKIGVALSGSGTGDVRIWSQGGSNRLYLGGNNQNLVTIDALNTKVGINTLSPDYELDVCGTIRGKEVRVETGWCDYVFNEDYTLASLEDVEKFIKENKHLPDVTPGQIIESEGLEVGKMSSQMIKKIEELTLYVIEINNKLKEKEIQLSELQRLIDTIK